MVSVLIHLVCMGYTHLPHRHHDRVVVVEHVPVVRGGEFKGIGVGEHYHVCSRCARPMDCNCD